MAQQFMPMMVMAMMLSSSASCVLSFMGGSGGSGGFWGGFTSGLMNPIGGVSDLFNLAVNGTGSGMNEADSSQYCQAYCGNCSQADFEKWASSEYIASAADARALCEGNKSGYSGSQTAWDSVMDKTSGGCC
jgi:hypothetical protein